ncbi:MAG: endonuclease family protein [Hyphomicrobiales bacterium]|nr:endonuclease family protein [Hyphomicrobiales bacterium]
MTMTLRPYEQPAARPQASLYGFAEEESVFEYERPMIEQTLTRPFRDQAFRRVVRDAYDSRCAISGLRLLNGGGRPEVQAAHIKAVEDRGPDSVRNGLGPRPIKWLA